MALLPERPSSVSSTRSDFGRRPLRLTPIAAAKKPAQVVELVPKCYMPIEQPRVYYLMPNLCQVAATEA